MEHDFTDVVISDGDFTSRVDQTADRDAISSDDLSASDVMSFKASSLTEFLCMTDLSNKRLLLHPAYGDLSACLQHYTAHRSSSSSACVVMPKWNGLWRKYLRGMQLLKDCSTARAFFVPADDASSCTQPLQVYFDSACVRDSICNAVGLVGLTMQFKGFISNAPANIFMDSCCSHTLMAASYARRMGFTVTPSSNPLQVEVASGTVCTALGTCKVRLKLQQYSADVTFSVVELAKQYEVILGEDWLSRHHATLSWEHSCCVVAKGGRKFTIVQSPSADVEAPQQVDDACPRSLSAMQPRRAVAQGCPCLVAACTDVRADVAHCAAAGHADLPSMSTASLVPESTMDALLHKFADRFPDELPAGLPPERNIGHTIPLEANAKPVFRSPYRLSPKEFDEAKRQIAELIARDHIAPMYTFRNDHICTQDHDMLL